MPCTLVIAGDSTAAIKGAGEKPMTGWGEYLQSYFLPEIRVDNRAINGRSTKSFIAEGRLHHIEQDLKEGDYLFIQFGHNDGKVEDPARYTDPDSTYRQNLKQFIDSARRCGATPVLLTSVSRRKFNKNGTMSRNALGAYPGAMRAVAQDTHTPLLDIFVASVQLYEELGEEFSKLLFMHLPENTHPNYPKGIQDDTHFSDMGARLIARLVAEAIENCEQLAPLWPSMKGEK